MATPGKCHHLLMTANWRAEGTSSNFPESSIFGIRLSWNTDVTNSLPRWESNPIDVQERAKSSTSTNFNIEYGFETAPVSDVGAALPTDKTQQSGYAEDYRTFLVGLSSFLRNDYYLESIRIYPYDGISGKALTPPSLFYPKALTKGSATTYAPTQIACAVTYQTHARGRGSTGRQYIGPLAASTISSNGRFSGAFLTAVGQGSAQLITNLNNNPGIDLPWSARAVVFHRPKSDYSDIIGVSVGNVPDTQRRRRKRESESYGDYTLP